MNAVSNKILELFKKNNKSYTFDELRKSLGIRGEESLEIIKESLASLLVNGDLLLNDKNRYVLFPVNSNYVQGKIYISKTGSGRIYDKNKNKIIIPKEYINGAVTNDIVLVLNGQVDKKGNKIGSVERIIKREKDTFLYEVNIDDKGNIVYRPLKGTTEIKLSKNYEKKLIDGEIISVRINPNGDVDFLESVGHKNDPDTNLKIIALNHDIKIEFSRETIEQLKTIPTEVREEDLVEMKDLRNLNIFTIDGEDTKDIDDALSINKLSNGNYLVGVHIALVSYYVKENTPMYNEAIDRGTSNYLGDSVIPMLPHAISNGICSLNPNVDRLTRSYFLEIDPDGNVVDFNTCKSVINSRKKMTYTDVNKILKNDKIPTGYEPYVEDLKMLDNLSKKISEKAKKNGKSDFGDHEIKYKEIDGRIKAEKFVRKSAEKMIEAYMVLTGTTWAQLYKSFDLPLVFRIHERPNDETVKEAVDYINSLGYNIKINGAPSDPKTIQNILEQLRCYEEFDVLVNYFLCTMSRARFSVDPKEHYGLGDIIYAQLTSPIRRAGDLINQILIDKYEIGDFSNIQKYLDELPEICSHISKKERNADEAEIESDLLQMVQYISNYIGEEFEGHVSFLNSHSMYVKTVEGIVGKVDFKDINDDYYVFDAKSQSLIGRKNKVRYKVGSKVKIKVLSASEPDISINFEIKEKILKR